ncbi:RipA family octameric membrane protein [Streptomyces mauvecolor]
MTTTGGRPDHEPGRPPDLELYTLAVEMADRVSARRGTANGFFLSVQTALVTVLGFGLPELKDSPWWAAAAVAAAGLALSGAWWLQLRSYRDLNTAKFKVITDLEKNPPVGIFTDEWTALRPDPTQLRHRRYAELGLSERTVPLVFAAVHLVVLVGTLLG